MEVSIKEAARILGRAGGLIGGRAKSPAKKAAARRNGKLGGRPKITNEEIKRFANDVVEKWRGLTSS